MMTKWIDRQLVSLEGSARRDEAWLQALLDVVWDEYFADVPQENDVRIVFGRRTKRRLGSIGLDPADRSTSVITMNSLFKSREIPEFVIVATLVHELTHYAHGFNSPLEQSQQHPHAGGVVRREYAERGLLDLYLEQKRWLKLNWASVIEHELASAKRPVRRLPASERVPEPWWWRKS